jgi:hypothetical protein
MLDIEKILRGTVMVHVVGGGFHSGSDRAILGLISRAIKVTLQKGRGVAGCQEPRTEASPGVSLLVCVCRCLHTGLVFPLRPPFLCKETLVATPAPAFLTPWFLLSQRMAGFPQC